MSTDQTGITKKLDSIVLEERNGYKFLSEKDQWYTRPLSIQEQHELVVFLFEERTFFMKQMERLAGMVEEDGCEISKAV